MSQPSVVDYYTNIYHCNDLQFPTTLGIVSIAWPVANPSNLALSDLLLDTLTKARERFGALGPVHGESVPPDNGFLKQICWHPSNPYQLDGDGPFGFYNYIPTEADRGFLEYNERAFQHYLSLIAQFHISDRPALPVPRTPGAPGDGGLSQAAQSGANPALDAMAHLVDQLRAGYDSLAHLEVKSGTEFIPITESEPWQALRLSGLFGTGLSSGI